MTTIREKSEQFMAMPAAHYIPHTPSATLLADGACRAILCEAAGRLNLTQPNGTVRANVPMVAGYNPVRAIAVNAPSSGTAATGVFVLY